MKFLLTLLVLVLLSFSAMGEKKSDNTEHCKIIAQNCVLVMASLYSNNTPDTEIMRVMRYCVQVYNEKKCPDVYPQ